MYAYEQWPSLEPYDWTSAGRGNSPYDAPDFHVDLGCGKLKKGRIGIDHAPSPGVNIVMDLNTLQLFGVPDHPGGDAVLSADNFEALSAGRGARLTRKVPEPLVIGLGLPFEDNSVQSMISHHALEHIGTGFLALMDEVYRVLAPGAIFRAITPLFPSLTAMQDPDHVRMFMTGTWEALCGTPGDTDQNCWQASFAVPYTQARFEMVNKDYSPMLPVHEQWGETDAREIRVALKAVK
ncbi:MAG: hypothetical protein NVS3B1_12730 [Marmoricola sp.]